MVRNEDFDYLTTDVLKSGEDATETISGTGTSLQFTATVTRDLHDSTDVALSNSTASSVTEDITVNYYEGVDATGTLLETETQSVTVAASGTETPSFLTSPFALGIQDFYIEVTQSGTDLTIDSIDENTRAATYTIAQSDSGELLIRDQYDRVRARYDAAGDGLTLPGTTTLTSDLQLNNAAELLFGVGGDIQATTDSSIAGEENSFVCEIVDSSGADNIRWRRESNNSNALTVFNNTTGNNLFQVKDGGTVEIRSGALDLRQNLIEGVEYLDLYSRDGSGDNWRFITYDTTGNFVFQHYPSGGGFQDAFEIEPSGTVNFPVGIDSETVNVGTNTEIFESAAGSTVIQNNAGNPINIQLSPSGRAYLTGNTTATTISTQDQWYEIEGAWQSAHMNFLSHDGIGGMTYDGDVTTQIAYDVGGSYSSPVNNATYEIALFKDGAVKPNTPVEFSPPRSGEVLSLPPIHGFTDSTTSGMRHSVRVRCTTGTDNITIPALSFRIKG